MMIDNGSARRFPRRNEVHAHAGAVNRLRLDDDRARFLPFVAQVPVIAAAVTFVPVGKAEDVGPWAAMSVRVEVARIQRELNQSV